MNSLLGAECATKANCVLKIPYKGPYPCSPPPALGSTTRLPGERIQIYATVLGGLNASVTLDGRPVGNVYGTTGSYISTTPSYGYSIYSTPTSTVTADHTLEFTLLDYVYNATTIGPSRLIFEKATVQATYVPLPASPPLPSS